MTDGKKLVKKNVAPCMGCGMRFPGCHAICLRFGVWREGLDRINEVSRAERKRNADVRNVIDHGVRNKESKRGKRTR